MEITDFLLARIAEDEAAARAAIDSERPGSHWHWVMDGNDTPVARGHLRAAQDDGETVSLRTVEEYPTRNGWSLPHFVVHSLADVHGGGGEHIARWDPARVLAECGTKRRIVELHKEVLIERPDDDVGIPYDALCEVENDDFPCSTLRLLALPYADHPDYDAGWRP